MRIYIASSLTNYHRVQEIRDHLTSIGHTITYDWTAHCQNSDEEANITVSPDGHTPSSDDLCAIALSEVRGVLDADVILAVMPGGRGTHFEMGLAHALDKVIIILAEKPADGRRIAFHYLPEIKHYASLDGVKFLLAKLDPLTVHYKDPNGNGSPMCDTTNTICAFSINKVNCPECIERANIHQLKQPN